MRLRAIYTEDDQKYIQELLYKLHTHQEIADIYGVSRSTMTHHILKWGLITPKTKRQRKKQFIPKTKGKYDDILYPKINEGVMYETYLKREKRKESDLSKFYPRKP